METHGFTLWQLCGLNGLYSVNGWSYRKLHYDIWEKGDYIDTSFKFARYEWRLKIYSQYYQKYEIA